MHHLNHLSAPKVRISWEFSRKQAQRCWENITIFKHSGLGDNHTTDSLEHDNQKEYMAVRDKICGWQLQFPLLIRNGSLQEWFLWGCNISQCFVTISGSSVLFLTISMEKVCCDPEEVTRKRLFQNKCFLKWGNNMFIYTLARVHCGKVHKETGFTIASCLQISM